MSDSGFRRRNIKRVSDLQRPFSLFFTLLFFHSSLLLSVSLPSFFKPSNYSNEWLRGRWRRRAVRDWKGWCARCKRGTGGGGCKRREIHCHFYLRWVSLIPWPAADWSVKINSWDHTPGPGVLSVVILTVWERMCGQVGTWIKMKMPLWGDS